MSLKLRLLLIPLAIILIGLVTLAFVEVHAARSRVRMEATSGLQEAKIALDSSLRRIQASNRDVTLAALERDIPAMRHARLWIELSDGQRSGVEQLPRSAPAWFTHALGPAFPVEAIPILSRERPMGRVLISASPDDELGEIWNEWTQFAGLLALVSFAIVGTIMFVVGQALKPLRTIEDGLDRLAGGDFDLRLTPFTEPELRLLSERFNHLAETLGRVTEDNQLLVGRLMSLQEEERKEIAHELHDEFGPMLFGIRAQVSSIRSAARRAKLEPAAIELQTSDITAMVAQIQRVNSRLLERLRPMVLDQVGLSHALDRLIDTWSSRYPEVRWERTLGEIGRVGEAQGLAIYRSIQECLTNIVRHANARRVNVYLSLQGSQLAAVVSDDGCGLTPAFRYGFGLLGMSERTRALGGRLEAVNNASGGARISILMPHS